jgi:hypothetical protein
MATIVWLVLIAGGLALLRTSRAAMLEGRAGTAVSGIAGLVLVTAGLVVPAIAPAGAAPPAMSARARSQLLDHFDAGRRPIAVIYDPLRLVSPEQAPSSLVFTARPDVARPAPVPRLLHAARWALPAGRYDVELIVPAGAVAAGSLGLQVGRAGPPIRTWTLAGSTGRTWRSRFSLAIDAGFVGFVPSADLAAMGPTVHVKPVDIESRSKRPPALEVVQTRHLGGADVYFHDDNADPEPAGFWTRRDRVTRVTVAADGGPHRLRIVAGPAEATVIVRMDDRLERIDLPPRGHHEVVMPADRSPCRIELDTRGGFVPAEIDPASDDARALGCWIEVVGGS